ncbi:MAG: hypothetical protein J6Y28_05055 [Acholeplasmatales bacterium]|nr:hypothetical protein [Methanobrevibacter sp.]MBP5445525.1 hypothetical protein [Acholeplasmatales bacterium]
MNVIFEEHVKTIKFSELEVGECFEVDGFVHVKIDKFIDFANDDYNCFCFYDNKLYTMFDSTEIIPVEAELHVRYKKE